MNALEDKVRAALRETGAEITEQSVPPLRLHGGGRRARRPSTGGRRWSAWLMPLAAAAAVVAVIAAPLAVSGLIHGRQHANAAKPQGPFAGLPPYYVVLTGKNPSLAAIQLQHAEIRATASGAVVTRLAPPPPYNTFSAVAAANDHTFVLAAERLKATRKNGGTLFRSTANEFFLLRLGAGGHISRLTPLPIPPEPARADVSGFALTPDGSKFAVALRDGVNGVPGPAIQVFSLSTGTARVWTWPGGGPITNNSGGDGQVLSWTADGRTLAFQQWVGNSINVRLLDTTTPGGSLQSASRPVLQWKGDAESLHFVHGKASNVIFGFSAIITPDGSKIVAATVSETKHPLFSELAFTEFSATTGKVVKVLGRWRLPGLYPGAVQDVLWTNPSGSTLIVLAHVPGAPKKDPQSRNVAGYGIEFGVLRGDRFTPLPGVPTLGPGPWPVW